MGREENGYVGRELEIEQGMQGLAWTETQPGLVVMVVAEEMRQDS